MHHLPLRLPVNKFLSFAVVGTVATIVHFAVLIALVQLFGIAPVIASSAGFVTGAMVNYLLNYHFTFKSRKSHRDAAVKFSIIATSGLMFNSILMHVGTGILAAHYLVSQAATTVIVLLWNFSANYLWSFRDHNEGV